jgi:hypothetical protein
LSKKRQAAVAAAAVVAARCPTAADRPPPPPLGNSSHSRTNDTGAFRLFRLQAPPPLLLASAVFVFADSILVVSDDKNDILIIK